MEKPKCVNIFAFKLEQKRAIFSLSLTYSLKLARNIVTPISTRMLKKSE